MVDRRTRTLYAMDHVASWDLPNVGDVIVLHGRQWRVDAIVRDGTEVDEGDESYLRMGRPRIRLVSEP